MYYLSANTVRELCIIYSIGFLVITTSTSSGESTTSPVSIVHFVKDGTIVGYDPPVMFIFADVNTHHNSIHKVYVIPKAIARLLSCLKNPPKTNGLLVRKTHYCFSAKSS